MKKQPRFTDLAALVAAIAGSLAFAGDPLEKPEKPLDSRVDASHITSSEPPALPRAIVQPLPATHRIAQSADEVPMAPEAFAKARAAIDKGLAYLRTTQRPSGAWMEREVATPTDDTRAASISLAVTALGVKAFVQAARDDPATTRALAYVGGSVRGKGFASVSESSLGTYVASAVVSAIAASEDTNYRDELQSTVAWLKETQWDQSEGISPAQDWFGGSGYGRHKRPDLSNTQMMLDALHDAGVSPDDPTVQRALVFVARAQNSKSTNPAPWAQAGANDGGFVYTPANGGESEAGEGSSAAGEPRTLRSYGSMTYAGFKSLLYAGLSREDPRVRDAWEFIRRHYTFDENPGMGQNGLYYYYHAMSRALAASQQVAVPPIAPPAPGAADATRDPAASPPASNWRDDLVAALVSRQRSDGSWVNATTRWEEGQPDLVTIYSVLALEEAIKPVLKRD